MNTPLRRGAVIALLLLFASCGRSGPTSPTGTNQPSAVSSPTPPGATNFPPLSGPSRTFFFDRQLSYSASDYTKHSRVVLYDNGAFVLQYQSLGGLEYRGGYKEASGVVAFGWEGWSRAGEWSATGTFKDESLTIQYNLIMQLTDFEDAVYVLMR